MKSIKRTLTDNELNVLQTAIELFIHNEAEGIDPAAKINKNVIALSLIKKLKNCEQKFGAEEVSVCLACLYFFISIIGEGNYDNTSDSLGRRMTEKIARDLIDYFTDILASSGFKV